MINCKCNKWISSLIIISISAILALLYYNFIYKVNKDYESKVKYSMPYDRFLYLQDKLSNVQQMMLKDPVLGKSYYTTYSKYEFSYFSKILDWFENDYVIKSKPIKVLDIGCAYGTFLFYIRENLPSSDLYCTDFLDIYFSKDLGTAKNINFALSNIEMESLPYTEKYDVIIFTEVLEHFNYNPISTMKKIVSHLKDDGTLYLSTPDSSSAWGVTTKHYPSFNAIPNAETCAFDSTKCTNIDDHVWQYNLRELLFVINMAGLEVDKLEYSFSGPHSRHFNLTLHKRKP